jgi:hypothetical protein
LGAAICKDEVVWGITEKTLQAFDACRVFFINMIKLVYFLALSVAMRASSFV